MALPSQLLLVTFAPNAFGLYDMHGNVYEWCWDGYDSNAYYDNPDIRIDPVVSSPTDQRTLRGGSWFYHPAYSALRGSLGAVTRDPVLQRRIPNCQDGDAAASPPRLIASIHATLPTERWHDVFIND